MQERAREQEKVQQNQPAHPSQAVVQTTVHSKTANRHLNAMEMIEWASTRHKREQMRQQQLEQQHQAALQEQQRNQQAALAGPGGIQQPPAAPLPAVSLCRMIAAVYSQARCVSEEALVKGCMWFFRHVCVPQM